MVLVDVLLKRCLQYKDLALLYDQRAITKMMGKWHTTRAAMSSPSFAALVSCDCRFADTVL